MKICIIGLGHLGLVTAACLAHVGHNVVGCGGLDLSSVEHEPGITDLLTPRGPILSEALWSNAIEEADIVWLTMDTPVMAGDVADVDAVIGFYRAVFPFLKNDKIIIHSSQLPVGWTRRMAKECPHSTWAYIPENLRMGKAVEVFLHPDRVVVGPIDDHLSVHVCLAFRDVIVEMFAPFTDKLEWMSAESAEMTKHAINAFLATEVTFINEIAAICEKVGADPRDVERGLKTESRIGPGAYLKPGGPYTGGHLGRDIVYLQDIGVREQVTTHLITGVRWSNREHLKREK